MTVWWGLAGLLGLLGCCGLVRGHRANGAIDDDPLARYPAAREPATPNADAAHTPLMTPAITPDMLAARQHAEPRREGAVPGAGRMAGEIPAPRPVEERPPVREEVAAPQGQAEHYAPGPRVVTEMPVPQGGPHPAAEAAVDGDACAAGRSALSGGADERRGDRCR
ncbi:hypothetical protein [Amycolatopsis vancoresmycina]|uniref:hypothetical protein n=1 Tax=Amycolatopsis vancoresmycina TaxID=208444 RepID=UPI0005260A6F|nr:hypothetical protein [Amycolatopsis vancoresmycina]